jgi:hypothetical protein
MPLTEKEAQLRQLARELIRQGRLPSQISPQIWGGYGSGRDCSLCGLAIPPREVEYETESANDGNSYRFHLLCHATWQLECARAEALAQTANNPDRETPSTI